MDFLSLLSAPVAYLEQEQYDFCYKDKDGYTALHYSAITMNFEWLKEVISINDDNFLKYLSVKTNNSYIKTELLPKLNQAKNAPVDTIGQSMSFGEGGFTVPHLLVWMLNYYPKQTHIDKIDKIKETLDVFIYLLDKNINMLKIRDGNDLSVLEHIIMFNLEDYISNYIPFINHPDFCPKLKEETIIKLIQKNSNHSSNEHKKSIIEVISRKRIKETIENELNQVILNDNQEENDDFKL